MGAGMGVTAVTPGQCWAGGRSLKPTSTLKAPPFDESDTADELSETLLQFALVEFGGGGISDGADLLTPSLNSAFAVEKKCRL